MTETPTIGTSRPVHELSTDREYDFLENYNLPDDLASPASSSAAGARLRRSATASLQTGHPGEQNIQRPTLPTTSHSTTEIPRFFLPLEGEQRPGANRAESHSTFTTARSNSISSGDETLRQGDYHILGTSAPLPSVVVREGYDIHSTDSAIQGPLIAARILSTAKTRKMSQRNDHQTNDEDCAAREPLIARTSDPASLAKADSLRRKLRTYDAFLALKEGYMPTTEQLAEWGRYALRSSGVLDSRNRRLSSKGREFLKDLRAWVEAVIDFGLSKNVDDKVQEFIYHTSHMRLFADMPDVGGAARVGVAGGGQDAGRVLERIRLAGSLLWSSAEFRNLLNEFLEVGKEIFADAASQVASTVSDVAERARSSDAKIPGDVNREAIREKARHSVYQTRDEAEAYLRHKFPKQRRDTVVNRLKKVVQDIQSNADIQDTVDFFIDLGKKYASRVKDNVVSEGKKADVSSDENFDIAIKDAQVMLMSLADGHPIDPITDALRQVLTDIQDDRDLHDFFQGQVYPYLTRLLRQKDYVTSDAADAEAHRLYDRSQELLSEKTDTYRPHVQDLFQEINSFNSAITHDRTNRQVADTSKKAFNDFIKLDCRGNFCGFRKRILWDIVEVVLPKFVQEIKYLPIPRIEYQDADFDLILENIVLESEHFLPTRTILESFTRAEFTNTYTFSSSYEAATHIHLSNLNLFAKDISFVARKKRGLVPFKDRGFLDVFITRRGASVDLVLESVSPHDDDGDDGHDGGENYFHVKSCKVSIQDFRYVYRGYHSWAANLMSPVVRSTVRRLLAKLLEERIRGIVEMADREVRAAAERMRVASIAGGSVEGWVKAVLSRPERRRKKRHGEYEVGVGEERLFPGEHGPGAWGAKVKRAEERVEAGGARGWRNQVFDVGA